MPEGTWELFKVLLLQMIYSLLVGYVAIVLIAASISFILYEDYIAIPVLYGLTILETGLVHYWQDFIVYNVWDLWLERIEKSLAWWSKFFF